MNADLFTTVLSTIYFGNILFELYEMKCDQFAIENQLVLISRSAEYFSN